MIYPILLCAVASVSTGLGGIIVAAIKKTTPPVLSFFQGFAAGVMITISFAEMIPHSYTVLISETGVHIAAVSVALMFICGWAAGIIISSVSEKICISDGAVNKAKRISLVTTAVMVLHNLPEGMITIFSGMEDAAFGAEMALAVALHNIPEGVVVASSAVSVSGSKIKGIGHSFLAGLSEFAGGVIAASVFYGIADEMFTVVVLAVVSGIMVQTSLCELIPNGIATSSAKYTAAGTMAGAAVIYVGLFLI